MRITIINTERSEKRYTRVELDEFVAQLKDGTYRQENTTRDTRKEVCFAAEWLKLNGELKAKNDNHLVLGKPARPGHCPRIQGSGQSPTLHLALFYW